MWVDDPDFDITYHVQEAAVPEPGDETQLLEFCARRMSCPLDRDRPLWQLWVIDGLSDGRVAVLEMIHHCLADGLAGVELASVLLDLEPRSLPHHSVDGWEPAPAPRRAIVLADGLAQLGGIVRRSRQTHGMPSGIRPRPVVCSRATQPPSTTWSRSRRSLRTCR